MTTPRAVLLDIVAWTALGFGFGYGAHRLSLQVLARDNWLTRIRPWEQGGEIYRSLRINRWKDALPEAGAFFRGGMSKRKLPGHDRDGLARFAAETRRAELVHWGLLGSSPVFVLWNPPVLDVAMIAYAVVANVPFIIIQRFNRARVARILARVDR